MPNIIINHVTYEDVPSILIPKEGGGQARFSDTSDATADVSDILVGKTAYANGEKIVGTVSFATVYTGSSAPSSALGSDGDIYLQT